MKNLFLTILLLAVSFTVNAQERRIFADINTTITNAGDLVDNVGAVSSYTVGMAFEEDNIAVGITYLHGDKVEVDYSTLGTDYSRHNAFGIDLGYIGQKDMDFYARGQLYYNFADDSYTIPDTYFNVHNNADKIGYGIKAGAKIHWFTAGINWNSFAGAGISTGVIF